MSDLYDIESQSCSAIIANVEGVQDGKNPLPPVAASTSVEPFDSEDDWQQVSY
jgi:hypothetical protein